MKRSKQLHSWELLDRINEALEQHRPLSVVSVGATETFVMSQYTILSEEEFMNHPEAQIANRKEQYGFGHRGVTFPNIQLRDEVVEAVRTADIVGLNLHIRLSQVGEPNTEDVFDAYDIDPPLIFESYLRRVVMFSQPKRFQQMLDNHRVFLIGEPAQRAQEAITRNWSDKAQTKIVGAIPIQGYEDIPEVLDAIDSTDFDLCLLAAGTNSLLLSSYISQVRGKVAFDIGSAMNSLSSNEVYSDPWMEDIIGLDNLMRM